MPRAAPWGVAAAAAIAAVGVPGLLLDTDGTPFAAPRPPLTTTRLKIIEVPELSASLARPLFGIDGAAGATGETGIPLVPPPMLVGVISEGRGGGVALLKASDGQTVTLRVGASLDGWNLTAVGSGQATLTRGSERQTVTLDFSNKPATVAPDASAPAPRMVAATSEPKT